jgi:hypothetical protein
MNLQEGYARQKQSPRENEAEEGIIAGDILEKEKFPSNKELIKEKYQEVINWREERYRQDVKNDSSKEGMRFNLNTHNEIVLDYAIQLIEKEELESEEKTEAIIATVMHDGGKLSSDILEHHERGVDYADKMLAQMMGKKIDGVEITEEVAQKVKEAIERHMNHPFMVMMNKGEEFPAPQDSVDRVVFFCVIFGKI